MIVFCDIDGCIADVREYVKKYLLGEDIKCPYCSGVGSVPTGQTNEIICPECKGCRKIKGRNSDWDEYFRHTSDFLPIPATVQLVKSLRVYCTVILITGRPESNRKLTEAWLDKVFGHQDYWYGHLKMRTDGDPRPTYQIKIAEAKETQKLFQDHNLNEPILVIDDDPEVIEASLKEGFTVMQIHGYRCTPRDNVPGEHIGK